MITKTENHIIQLSPIAPQVSQALGEMVIAYGRLEDMIKVAIKRLENRGESLEEVIKRFSGTPLGKLKAYCNNNLLLSSHVDAIDDLNKKRQDFIHSTIAVTEEGNYVRFRKLTGYVDIERDCQTINSITDQVNALIQSINEDTRAPLGTFSVSAAATRII